jgi:myosin-crossreactive antigen
VLGVQAMTGSVSTWDQPQTEDVHGLCGKTYFVGGGIGSPAATALMIRDARINGESIFIFENVRRLGGSLGDSYSVTGYAMPGTTKP